MQVVNMQYLTHDIHMHAGLNTQVLVNFQSVLGDARVRACAHTRTHVYTQSKSRQIITDSDFI